MWLRLMAMIAVITCLSACKGRKTVDGDANAKGMDKEKAILQHLNSHLHFDVLTLKGKADFEDTGKGTSMGFAYRIDIAKDSLMLVSISKFGIPAMNMLLSPDSVKMRVSLNQTASVCDYQLFNKMLGMDFNLGKFQDYILGDADLAEPITMTSGKGDPITLQSQRPPYSLSWILNSHTFRLEKMSISDPNLGKESVLTYSEFEKIDGQYVASTLNMVVTQPQELRISLHHTGIEFDKEKVDFRFRIPATYKLTPCDELVPKQPK